MSIIIRLDNLSWNATSLDIRRYFYGLEIPDGGVHIVGGDSGTAFIGFATDEDARQAMLKNGGIICNMTIRLFLSSKTEMQNVVSAARGLSGSKDGGVVPSASSSSFGRLPTAPFDGSGPNGVSGYYRDEPRRIDDRPQRPPSPPRSQLDQRVGRPFPGVPFDEFKYPRDSGQRSPAALEENRWGGKGSGEPWESQVRRDVRDPEISFARVGDSNQTVNWMRNAGPSNREPDAFFRPGNQNRREELDNFDRRRQDEFDFDRRRILDRDLKTETGGLFQAAANNPYFNDKQRRVDSPFGSRQPYQEFFVRPVNDRGVAPMDIVREPERSTTAGFPHDTDRRSLGAPEAMDDSSRSIRADDKSVLESWYVRVSNLPLEYYYRDIRRLFVSSHIPAEGLKLINDENGTKTDECLIMLHNERNFQNALAHDGDLIAGSRIRVDQANAREFHEAVDSYKPPDSRIKPPDSFKRTTNRMRSRSPLKREEAEKPMFCVIVKNLPLECDENDVRKFLGNPKVGPGGGPYFEYDTEGNRMIDAVVRLDTAEEYDAALNCNKRQILGQKINVIEIGRNYFDDRALAARRNEMGNKNRKGNSDQKVVLPNERGRMDSSRSNTGSRVAEEKFWCVQLFGLPFEANATSIKDFFKGLEIANDGIQMVYNDRNNAAGIAFVEFVTSTDCKRALERNCEYMGKRYIKVEAVRKEDVPSRLKRYQLDYKDPRVCGGDRDREPPSYAAANTDSASSETIVRMTNLHFKVQLEDILQFFSGHHPIVESIKLQYRNGKPTGDGLVSFPSQTEAEQVVNKLNHKLLLGWPLTMHVT